MAVRYYEWTLCEQTESVEERYCPHCGERTLFRDSTKRRVNANGKDLFEYAIYKCERDHTWNKKLGIYKAKVANGRGVKDFEGIASKFETINMKTCADEGIKAIEIRIIEAIGEWRLDKLLATAIEDWSRTEIVKRLANGEILVNQSTMKPGTIIKKGYHIEIHTENDETARFANEFGSIKRK